MSKRLLTRFFSRSLLALLIFLLAASTVFAQSGAFTYQGRLTDNGNPANGIYDMEFKLFDTVDVGTGTQQGATITNSTVQVTNGVFAVQLDFGLEVFDGTARFLEISLRPAGSADPYTVLAPRQPITSTPYAIQAVKSATSDAATNSAQLGGIDAANYLRLDENGNLGIGTPTPTTKLEVLTPPNSYGITHSDGTIQLRTFLGSGDAAWIGTITNHPLYLYANGTLCAAFDPSGRVGIGTTLPMHRLSVLGGPFWTSNAWRGALELGNASAIGWQSNAGGQRFGIGQSGGGLYFFRTASDPGTTTAQANYDLFISDAGSVGIGTTSPLSGNRLDVVGNTRMVLANGTMNFGSPNTETGMTVITPQIRADLRLDNSALKLVAGPAGFIPSATSGIAINTAGNVGIGITTPVYKLQVESGGYSAILGRTNGGGIGVQGISNGAGSAGILGESDNVGVQGTSTLVGVQGTGTNAIQGIGTSIGVAGRATNAPGIGVYGENPVGDVGVRGLSPFIGVEGITTGDPEGQGVRGSNGGSNTVGYAGRFNGRVLVSGNLSKGGGSFLIDHPLDPANKYLSHSFVESPDMMNIYNGNVTTDESGEAVVQLPDYFEALNRDFRYQLTVIGQFAQAIVLEKIKENRFKIKTDKPSVEVSWQVTGIRQDAYANANRIPVEEEKPERERGFYLYPKLFNQPEEKSIEWARYPQFMQLRRQGEQQPKLQLLKQ
ncbi:MAG TPA: hypothetical protein VFO63_04025 [Blastocatellia bacterium]|nr:hypothetical protein [Blastocatellia bacterium]